MIVGIHAEKKNKISGIRELKMCGINDKIQHEWSFSRLDMVKISKIAYFKLNQYAEDYRL